MDHLMHRTPEEQPNKRRKVENRQNNDNSSEARNFSPEYTKGITLENRYLQQFAKDTKQISEELTELEKTIPMDLPKLELEEGIQKRIDEYENKQKEQQLFPALKKRGQPPIYWKVTDCENRIKHGEKRINSLARYNNFSSKDLQDNSEDLQNLYRYLQKRHYQRFREDCEDLKKVFLYLFKEYDKDLKNNYEDIAENYKSPEYKHIEKQYIDLKEQYKTPRRLKEYYDRLEILSHEDIHDNLEIYNHTKDIMSRRENLRDLEEFYQHQYHDPYKNLEEHLKDLKQRSKNLEARRYTYLEKDLQDLENLSSYLIEHCASLSKKNRKYLQENLKKLKEQWEKLEKPGQNLEERCKNLEERWKDFVESSKAYLPDIQLLHQKMKNQEKELLEILDIYNDKMKQIYEYKLKELHTFGDRSQDEALDSALRPSHDSLDHEKESHDDTYQTHSQKSEHSSYQDDSHSVPTRFENLPIDNLTRHIDKLEKFIDDKRAIIHRDLKNLAFHLEGDLFYFLEKQRYKTDFYLKNSNLLHLSQADQQGQECGIACTMMVADLSKSWKNVEKLLHSFTEVYPKVLSEGAKILTATYTYPIVLKRIEHHINYEYAKVPDIVKKKYQAPKTDAKWDKAYRSHTGKDPKEITVDEFKNAIGQKDTDGNVIPVIASITMDFHIKCYHSIVLDGWDKTPEGEELLVARDVHTDISPDTGKPLTNNQGRLWKDFLEVWTGVAVIPTIENGPN